MKCKSLLKILVTALVIACIHPCFAEPVPALQTSEQINTSDDKILSDSTWATDENLGLVTTTIKKDVNAFAPKNLDSNHISFEVRVSIAFMNAMSKVGAILDSSLVRFAMIFILLAYAFWVGIEAYNMMTKGTDAKELVYNILIKGVKISVWFIIISFGPAKVFMWIMGPILSLGTYMANLILDAVSNVVGVELPNNCAAIAQYAAANINSDAIIDATAATDMICLPTQMSEFFKTTLKIGFKWVGAGIAHSLLTFLSGIALVVLSVRCIWKFVFMTLDVIADLFLAVMMLPFTAIAETTNKTSYTGPVGSIYSTFLSVFAPEKLDAQIKKFISAALFYVVLAGIIGISTALLSGVLTTDMSHVEPTQDAGGFIIILLVMSLVLHIANKAESIANSWGGSVSSDLGTRVKNDVKGLWNLSVGQVQKWKKALKGGK